MIVTAEYRANYADIEWGPLPHRTLKRAAAMGTARSIERSSGVQAPYVISDTMDGTWHPATGQVLDSKAKFRQITREHGLEEVGNERMIPREPKTVSRPGPDIKRAIEELRGR